MGHGTYITHKEAKVRETLCTERDASLRMAHHLLIGLCVPMPERIDMAAVSEGAAPC